MRKKRITKNRKGQGLPLAKSNEPPKWKILGFEDVQHYLDYKRNNDLDSVINDIDDFYESWGV